MAESLVEVTVFRGKRPGGKVLGRALVPASEIRGHGWSNPLIRQRVLTTSAIRYVSMVDPLSLADNEGSLVGKGID